MLTSSTVGVAALLVPELRTVLLLVAVWIAPVLVLLGRHRRHRGSGPWAVQAAMLTSWAAGFTAGEVLGRDHPAVLVRTGTGQLLGIVVDVAVLVTVAALAWVTAGDTTDALPSWVVPVAGDIVAARCLVRAAGSCSTSTR